MKSIKTFCTLGYGSGYALLVLSGCVQIDKATSKPIEVPVWDFLELNKAIKYFLY